MFIDIENLTKIYRNNTIALNEVSLKVKEGSTTSIIGENGAGKSTLINILISLITKSSGNVSIFGKILNEQNDYFIKKNIGFVGEQIGAYEHLNVVEYWRFIANIYKINKNYIDKRIEELLYVLSLDKSKKKLIREFSKGMKQKALLGGVLIHNPRLLILDEPLDGIDPSSKIIIKNILQEFNRNGSTILISSHDFSIIEDICSDVIVMNEGKVKFQDTVENMHKQYNGLTLEEIFIKIVNRELDVLRKKLSWGGKND